MTLYSDTAVTMNKIGVILVIIVLAFLFIYWLVFGGRRAEKKAEEERRLAGLRYEEEQERKKEEAKQREIKRRVDAENERINRAWQIRKQLQSNGYYKNIHNESYHYSKLSEDMNFDSMVNTILQKRQVEMNDIISHFKIASQSNKSEFGKKFGHVDNGYGVIDSDICWGIHEWGNYLSTKWVRLDDEQLFALAIAVAITLHRKDGSLWCVEYYEADDNYTFIITEVIIVDIKPRQIPTSESFC